MMSAFDPLRTLARHDHADRPLLRCSRTPISLGACRLVWRISIETPETHLPFRRSDNSLPPANAFRDCYRTAALPLLAEGSLTSDALRLTRRCFTRQPFSQRIARISARLSWCQHEHVEVHRDCAGIYVVRFE